MLTNWHSASGVAASRSADFMSQGIGGEGSCRHSGVGVGRDAKEDCSTNCCSEGVKIGAVSSSRHCWFEVDVDDVVAQINEIIMKRSDMVETDVE